MYNKVGWSRFSSPNVNRGPHTVVIVMGVDNITTKVMWETMASDRHVQSLES